jgi:hypothetical protein
MHPNLPPPPAPVGAVMPVRSLARDAFGREVEPAPQEQEASPAEQPAARPAATETIGARAGALSDELDFPEFVASLVHGTFDAIVDSSIRQMESFADLVAAVAKPIDQFTQEHVSLNQARDWLVQQYPGDLQLERGDEGVRVAPRPALTEDGDETYRSPDWLRDFGLEGSELTAEVIEEQLLPLARERVAQDRLQTLSTMVLLGMNRVVVRDGTIGARLRFRAAAADHAKVDYAVSDDANAGAATEWGRRGSRTFDAPTTKVSTVGVNVQTDSELKAELFGEVKINFASETIPLDRFVDDARRTLLERHARPNARGARGADAARQQMPAQLPPSAATPPASAAPPAAVATPPAAVAAPAPAAPAPVTPAAPGAAR